MFGDIILFLRDDLKILIKQFFCIHNYETIILLNRKNCKKCDRIKNN